MKDLKILHLANDEKFIDQAINAFEHAVPGANSLYLYSNRAPKYVKTRPQKKVSLLSLATGKISRDLKKYDLIILHSLHTTWMKTISKAPKGVPIVWLGWGYDYYDIILTKDQLTLPLTKTTIKKRKTTLLRGELNKGIKTILKKTIFPTPKESAIARIDYFAPVLPEEYSLTRAKYKGKHFPQHIQWNYGTLENDLIKGFESSWVTGENILIGNSATEENNHTDIFSELSKQHLGSRQIITPLSYGDNEYRDAIILQGRTYFGENLTPLTDFIPIKEYVTILESCGFAVMNHVRQQAVGNILIMLYLGAKIFLRKENPAFRFFTENGAKIYTVQELEAQPSLIHMKLDPITMQNNRDVAMKTWSSKASHLKTLELLKKTIYSNKKHTPEAI